MPTVPMNLSGVVRLVAMPANAGLRDAARAEAETVRQSQIARRRLYYDGEQYDAQNRDALVACGKDPLVDRLPEHDRRHAYSTQIADAVDFIAGQIAESFGLKADDSGVQDVLERSLRASAQFTGDNADDEIAVDELLRDALIGGDVAAEVKWDPIDEVAYAEVWESEHVEFVWADRRHLQMVIRSEVIWVPDATGVGDVQVVERVVYDVVGNEFGVGEARRQVFWDDEDEPREVEMLGLPMIPWVLLKGDTKGLRKDRGTSLVTEQAMQHADRYNANEQVGYLIARYNSHGNLAVVGDAAHLKIEENGGIGKDVADVLTFPGGTSVQAITLPSDPTMIEHQRAVLAEAIYQTFGLTRVDPETISTLGGVSGYALEILNRKTEGTFRRIRRNWTSGLRSMFSMFLDVTAYKQDVRVASVDEDGLMTVWDDPEDVPVDLMTVGQPFWLIDPALVFPRRKVEIRMGSGYIVDDVLVRDDYTSGLISRAEALRQRGRSDTDIARIEQEIEDEAPEQPEVGMFGPTSGTAAGSTVGGADAEQGA